MLQHINYAQKKLSPFWLAQHDQTHRSQKPNNWSYVSIYMYIRTCIGWPMVLSPRTSNCRVNQCVSIYSWIGKSIAWCVIRLESVKIHILQMLSSQIHCKKPYAKQWSMHLKLQGYIKDPICTWRKSHSGSTVHQSPLSMSMWKHCLRVWWEQHHSHVSYVLEASQLKAVHSEVHTKTLSK